MFFDSREVQIFGQVGWPESRCWTVDCVLKAVTICEEICVLDFASLIAVNKRHLSNLINCQREAEVRQHLSEDLLADLEMDVFVEVLEEALGIKSVLPDNFFKPFNNVWNFFAVRGGWVFLGVDSLGADVIQIDVGVFL